MSNSTIPHVDPLGLLQSGTESFTFALCLSSHFRNIIVRPKKGIQFTSYVKVIASMVTFVTVQSYTLANWKNWKA
ncbi:hypothetical protein ES708_17465 [subsurface metagenome]